MVRSCWTTSGGNDPEPSLPRRVANGRQVHRANVSGNAEEYYRRTITIPFLDNLLAHLKERFGPFQQLVATGHCLTPKVLAEAESCQTSLP